MLDLCTQHIHEESLARYWEKCDNRNSHAKSEDTWHHGPKSRQGVAHGVNTPVSGLLL